MTKLSILLTILLLLVFSQPSFSEIYKWVDKDGSVRFSDKKPPEKAKAETVKLKINTVKNPSIYNHSLGASDKVIMYSASWGGVCKTAKKYFRSQGIPYKEYDVENSTKGRNDFKQLRGRGVPIILIGKQRMDGFDRSYFEKLYEG